LRTAASDEDSSSEENLQRSKNRRRSSSHDRRGGGPVPNNGHLTRDVTQSERDLTRVTKVRVRTNANLAPSTATHAAVASVPGGGGGSSAMLTKENSSNSQPQFKPRTKMKTTTMIVTSEENDVVRAPLNWQLVEQTISQLQKSSDDLVQLYKRISLDYDMEDGDRAKMLQKLAFMAGVSQQTLKPVNPTAVLPDHANAGNKNPYVQHMLDNYSMIQQQPSSTSSTSQQNQGPSWC